MFMLLNPVCIARARSKNLVTIHSWKRTRLVRPTYQSFCATNGHGIVYLMERTFNFKHFLVSNFTRMNSYDYIFYVLFLKQRILDVIDRQVLHTTGRTCRKREASKTLFLITSRPCSTAVRLLICSSSSPTSEMKCIASSSCFFQAFNFVSAKLCNDSSLRCRKSISLKRMSSASVLLMSSIELNVPMCSYNCSILASIVSNTTSLSLQNEISA